MVHTYCTFLLINLPPLHLTAILFVIDDSFLFYSVGISMFYFCWISVKPSPNIVQRFAVLSLFLYYLPQFVVWIFALVTNFIAVFVLLTGLPASSETRQHVLKQNTSYVLVLGLETFILLPLWIAQLSISGHSSLNDSKFCFYTPSSFAFALIFAVIHSLRGVVDLCVWWFTFSLGFKDFKDLWSRLAAQRRSLFSQNTLCTPLVNSTAQKSVNKNLRRDVMYCINYGILDAVRLNTEEEARRTELGSVRDPFMAHVMMKFDENKHHEETEQKFSNPQSQETHVRRIPFQPSNNLRDFSFIDIEPTIFGLIRNNLGISSQEYQQSFAIKDELDVESSGMLEKFTEGKSGSFFYFTRDFRYIIKTITEEEETFLRKIAYKYYAHMQNNPDSVIVRLYGLHKVRLARLQRYIAVVVMENLFYNEENLKMHERYDLKGSTIGRRVLKGNKNSKDKYKKTLKDLDFTSTVSVGQESKQQLLEQLRSDVEFLSELQIMDYSLLLGIHHHTKDGSTHQRSMNIDIDGDEITFVDIGGSYKSTPNSSPNVTTTTKSLGVPDKRHRTHSSVFTEDNPISSLSIDEQNLELRGPYVPWFRRDYGGLKSSSPQHPLTAERPESMSMSIIERINARHLPPSDTYYLGMVDILQVYNLSKKLEHFTKTKLLCKDKYGISAVDPQTYGRRFLQAMDRIFE